MCILRKFLGGGDITIARARRPAELAAGLRAAPREGLDWLGRTPSPRAPRSYRLLVGSSLAVLRHLCRLGVEIEGRERLPAGGYVAFCALHRSWIDPLLVIEALPLEPRVWFMGSGPSAFDRAWKERLLRRTGGLLPVWRGGTDIAVHVRAASAVIEQGAVLALFAEGAVGGPADRPARMRSGAALLCLRTQAPIVPVAICGAEELYRGKRMSVRILEPVSPAELLGKRWDRPPEPGSRDELRAARELTHAITERIAIAVRERYADTVDPPTRPRRWRWLTRLLR
jgi:1-acyl-sn-glycerol-3-phosphate acyltransferase